MYKITPIRSERGSFTTCTTAPPMAAVQIRIIIVITNPMPRLTIARAVNVPAIAAKMVA